VELNASVLTQVLNYHMGMPVKYIMITNGEQCFVADMQNSSSQWVEEFPDYK
jgi:predicted type IV restriction endonuclease